MSSMKYKINKFNGKNNFSLWRIKMHALLTHQGFLKALSEKDKLQNPISDELKDDLEAKAHSTIQLCLSDVLREIAEEETAADI